MLNSFRLVLTTGACFRQASKDIVLGLGRFFVFVVVDTRAVFGLLVNTRRIVVGYRTLTVGRSLR